MFCKDCLIWQNKLRDNKYLRDTFERGFSTYSVPKDVCVNIGKSLDRDDRKLMVISALDCQSSLCKLISTGLKRSIYHLRDTN